MMVTMSRMLVVAFLLAACSPSNPPPATLVDMAVVTPDPDLAPPPPPPDMTVIGTLGATIVVTDDKYTPMSVTINRGQKVRWVFMAGGPHGVFPADMGFPYSPIQQTGTFENIFLTPGTFNYSCAVHGLAMPGQIIVQ